METTAQHYTEAPDTVLEQFATSREGLRESDVEQRRSEHGWNELEQERSTPSYVILLNQFKDPLIYILAAAALFTLIIQEFVDMAVILTVIGINAVIGFFQEYKAEQSMEAIRQMAAPRALVIRNGQEQEIESREIVPGDIVRLSAGEKVSADLRILESSSLQVDESAFTGESTPVQKKAELLEGKDRPVADQKNMVFMGSIVTAGRGLGVAVRTGMATELGQISSDVSSAGNEKTPLQKSLLRFSQWLGIFALVLGVVVCMIGYVQGKELKEMILFSISMMVAAIPEGLPVVITITMALGIRRMAEHRAVVRKLIAVETLGSCDYICSDKTGTITENRMSVEKARIGDDHYEWKGEGYEPEGEIRKNGEPVEKDEALESLLTCAILCNDARLHEDEGRFRIQGDPTEGALLVAAARFGFGREALSSRYPRQEEVPFDSAKKFMATLHRREDGFVIYVKGAPEKMKEFCRDVDEAWWDDAYASMARDGLRVLALGEKEADSAMDAGELESAARQDVTLLGLVGLMDPPRANVAEAIRETKQAGIRVVMITGDHRDTAAAIARKVGILDDQDILTGPELEEMDDEALAKRVNRTAVYARTTPQHKIRIVTALQDRGHSVAVTGDGVNDAPALKKATIGVAMGRAGTDVAREASEIILQDDNFATIVEAIKQGRIIFENIRKVIFFLLSSGAGIVLFIIATLLLRLPLPFSAVQVLWVNLVTNGLQDVALAFEEGEEGLIQRPPRDPSERIINRFVLIRLILAGLTIAAGTLGVFLWMLETGKEIDYARTAAFHTVVLFQFFHVFNSRSFSRSILAMPVTGNPFLLISVSAAMLAQVLALYWTPLQHLLGTKALDWQTWLLCGGVAATVLVVMEVDKWIRQLRDRQ